MFFLKIMSGLLSTSNVFYGFLLRPVGCKELLKYMVQWLNCIDSYNVTVPADYIPNAVACVDMTHDFVDCVVQLNFAMVRRLAPSMFNSRCAGRRQDL